MNPLLPLVLYTVATIAGAAIPAYAGPLRRLDGSKIKPEEIDRFITDRMQEAHVAGFAIAILQHNEVVYLKAFGERDVERHLPLEVDSVMYGASLTKGVFGVLVATLAEAKVIDLDRPIAEVLNQPWSEIPKYADLAADPRANRITPRMLLSHTAGFANFRFLEPDGKLHIHFEPGTQYAYSGEGINLLQLVVEKVFATFLSAVMSDKVLSARAKKMLLMPRIKIRTGPQFPTLAMKPTRDNDRVGLAYGLGWGLLTKTPVGLGYFKEGHEDGWRNYALAFDRQGIGVVLMSNSDNGDSLFRPVLEKVMANHVTPWAWHGYP
jgi:CubicO group peptidase (beta-lactamase class C family)